MRHRFHIWDGLVILALACLLGFLGLEYDILRHSGLSTGRAAELEGGEIVLIALVLGAFALVARHRLRAQAREVERRTAAERHARELALQDPLTGLANRRHFDEAVASAVAGPPGADRVHAVLMLDLNRFKAINDVYGHPVGDQVLMAVALRLSGCVRVTDVVARLGGDEFAVVATHLLGVEEAASIGLRIVEALQAPVEIAGNLHSVGVGIGIALYPQDASTASELVRRADIALYRAKAERLSSVKFFQEDMDAQVRERAHLEARLRTAVADAAITCGYQPQVDLGTGRVTGFEALARWHDAELGEVPPERFIPVAEESGVMIRLGRQILARACADASAWDADAIVSVNVSPVQLHAPDFEQMVRDILRDSGLPAHRLELEITENTLVRDLQVAQQALNGLRDSGVRIALDDFGTGYSSLYHLRNFKVDRIKIDRSFVESMSTEAESEAIVRALLGLGHGLGVKVTAEGVQDSTQRARLADEGCDEAQGFLFSEALTSSEARDYLASRLAGSSTST